MFWVLIMVASYSGHSVSVSSAEFATQELCIEAGKAFKSMDGFMLDTQFRCVKKAL